MEVTVLIENLKPYSKELISENGLCIYIKNNDKQILFDTGRTKKFIHNAKQLGINIKDIDAVVISHGHGDHGGGLLEFLKINSKAKIYIRREAFNDFYFRYMFFTKNVSINKSIFEKYSYRIHYIDKDEEIFKDIHIIANIKRYYEIPEGNKYLYIKNNNTLIKDNFNHELIMSIKEQDGLTVFTGCSHNGTANMIKTVREKFPQENIKALIGGFHLVKIPIIKSSCASDKEINILVNEIIKENVQKVYTGHCTGEKAYKKLKGCLNNRIHYIKTGSKINL